MSFRSARRSFGSIFSHRHAAVPAPLVRAACETLEQRKLLAITTYYVDNTPGAGGSDGNTGLLGHPWLTIDHAVNTAAHGSIIDIHGGTYRDPINLPNNGTTGTTTLEPWAGTGTVYIEGAVQLNDPTGWVNDGTDGHGGTKWHHSYSPSNPAEPPQQVFNNGTFLAEIGTESAAWSDQSTHGLGKVHRARHPVGSGVADLTPNTFYWNSDVLNIDLPTGTSPGSDVEITNRTQLITHSAGASGYDINGLTFRYSNGGADGSSGYLHAAVEMPVNSTLENSVLSYNGYAGVSVSDGSVIANNDIAYNGAIGITSGSDNESLSIHDNHVEYNNYRHFDAEWAGSGIKLISTAKTGHHQEGNVFSNEVDHNYGVGIWSDTNQQPSSFGQQLLIYRNYVHDNAALPVDFDESINPADEAGIKIEVSQYVRVFDNVVTNNSPNGIALVASQHVAVYNNTVAGNRGLAAIGAAWAGSRHTTNESGTEDNMPLEYNTIENNLIYNNSTTYDLLLQQDSKQYIDQTLQTTPGADNNISDYNLFYRWGGPIQLSNGNAFSYTSSAGTAFSYRNALGPVRTTLTGTNGWATLTGHDTHSTTASPAFITASGETYTIGSNSAAKGAGAILDLDGNGATTNDVDYTGTTRTTPFDIGAYKYTSGSGTVDPAQPINPQAWVDDALPTGAIPVSFGNGIETDAPTWLSSATPSQSPFTEVPSPVAQSGHFSLAPEELASDGVHATTFDSATQTMTVNPTDTLVAYVYMPADDKPSELLLQFLSSSNYWYRVYYGGDGSGANQITNYSNIEQTTTGSTPASHIAAVPTGSGWQRLEIPASYFGISSPTVIKGLSLDTYGGQAVWDDIGVNVPLDGWSLDSVSGGTTKDAFGSHDGTTHGTVATGTGKSGNDVVFDGSSTYIDTGDTALPTNSSGAMSVSGWFNFKSNPADAYTALGVDKQNSFRLVAWNDPSNHYASQYEFDVWDATGLEHTVKTATYYPNDTWHYVTGTYDGAGNLNIYVDGAAATTTSWAQSGSNWSLNNPGTTFQIGRRDNTSRFFEGQLDEIRLYDNVLTQTQATSNYQSYFNGGTPTAPAAASNLKATVSGGSATLSWSDNSTNEDTFRVMKSTNGGATYTQIAALAPGSTGYVDSTLGTGATAYYKIIASNTAGDAAASNVYGARSGLVASYLMDENSGTTTADNSGNGNTGNFGTHGPSWTSGEFGSALGFNGTTQYVDAGNGSTLAGVTGAMTVGGWFKQNATGGFDATGVDKKDQFRIVATHANTASTTWQVMLTDTRGNGFIHLLNSSTNYNNGQWVYVVATYDGAGDIELYVNGTQDGELTKAQWDSSGAPSYALNSSAYPLEIGRRDQFRYFSGSIDQVQVLNRAMTSNEIHEDWLLSPAGGGSGVHTNLAPSGFGGTTSKKPTRMVNEIGLT